jgi:peptidoglycan/xylan/chitin deacetylase (PgdA/CDA1 family)
MIRHLVALAVSLVTAFPALAASTAGTGLVEPQLHLLKSKDRATHVALTFDACMGKTDFRILQTLVDENIKATIFVTGRWVKSNPQALAILKGRPDLFEIENHGAMHVPAVDQPMLIYGIAAAGSIQAVEAEVQGGSDSIVAAGIAPPRWFRGSTARYSRSAIADINSMGYRIAGYSINGDGGSLLGAKMTEKHIAAARDGDVVIAHINQPTHEAGQGVVAGILALKAKGVVFVRLLDSDEDDARH